MTNLSETDLPSDAEGWSAFFARFEDVVLVANSDAVDIEKLKRTFSGDALFVFFNKTYKVLEGRFERPSLLVARSSEAGANIVYRREVEAVIQPFDKALFHGILNLRAAARETFSSKTDFGGGPVGFLDVSGELADIYPDNHVPSSGFALAIWLAERRSSAKVSLAGFSAKRSERWKLFQAHDWTFEQTAQRMLIRAGYLQVADEASRESRLVRLSERFPDISTDFIALTATEVLGERLANTDAAIDRLFSLTRWQGKIDHALRALKPKTRKQRLAETSGGDNAASGLAKKGGAD